MKDVVLTGGLDLRTPPALIPPGRLRDCLNYETGIEPGYRVIEGFERVDGRMSPSVRDIWDFTQDSVAITPIYSGNSFADGLTGTRRGVAASEDGDWFFVLIDEGASAYVYQWHSSQPWDASYALMASSLNSFDVTSETADPTGFCFSADGSKMYVCSATVAYEYTLGVDWDVGTATYSGNSYTFSAQENLAVDVAISDDGTALFVVGTQNDTVYQYTLGTAYDVSTASYASKSVAVPTGETAVTSLAFTESGARLAVLGTTLTEVHLYWLSTPWDVSTATIDELALLDVSSEDANPVGLHFSPDGLRFYTLGEANNTVYQYHRSFLPNENITWTREGDSGDLGVVIAVSFTQSQTTVRFAYWSIDDDMPDYATLTGDDTAVSFTDDFPGSVYTGKMFAADAHEANPSRFVVSSNGEHLYIEGTGNIVYEYDLSPAWDISSASYSGNSKDITDQTASPILGALSVDGTKLYVVDFAGDTIYQYTLGTAWDISTASYASLSLTLRDVSNVYRDVKFSPDGLNVYVSSQFGIVQYTLGTAWDISTGTFTAQFRGPVENTFIDNPLGIALDSGGYILFMMGYSSHHEEIIRFDLTTQWNIGTARPASRGVLDVGSEAFTPSALEATDTYFYVFSPGSQEDIFQYRRTPAATFTALVDTATDADDYFTQLYAASQVLRGAITPVPGSGPVLGVKWYRGDLYAIRDVYRFEYMDGNGIQPEPDQHVVLLDSQDNSFYGDEGIVVHVDVNIDTFPNSSAEGVLSVEPLNNTFDVFTPLAQSGSGRSYNRIVALSEIYFSSGSTEPSQGDTLTGDTSTETAILYRVELQSGAWADGDAAGIMYVHDVSGQWTRGENVNTNIFTMDDMLFTATHVANNDSLMVAVREAVDGDARAALYRSSRSGWQKIDLGYEVRFENGGNEPPAVRFGADTASQTVTTTDWKVATQHRDLGLGWLASAGTVVDAVAASGGTYAYPDPEAGWYNLEQPEWFLALHDFEFGVPDGARVVGIEIEVTAKNTAAATEDAGLILVQPFVNDVNALKEAGQITAIDPKRQALGELTNVFVAYAFGGENDLWNGDIDLDMVNSEDFGVKLKMEWDSAAAGTAMQIDLVRMRVHYVEQGSRVYLSEGVNEYTNARLVHFNLEGGAWAGADAYGTMQVYDLLKKQIPTSGVEIRSATGGGGTLYADLVGNERRVSLPGSALLKDNASRYELIAENVYARDDLEAIYGVSGAGFAWSYDRFYFRLIRSGLSPDLDKPRHVDLFQFRLWLGYQFGEVAVSVAGEPLSFDGSLNAVATGFGRPIVGFTRLNGQTMGVVTDKITYAVTVSGADFDQQILGPRVGGIEYTVKETGLSGMYLDPRGVTTPSATDKYGDFQIGRLSESVNKWLLPRLQARSQGTSTRDRRIVAASVVPHKNQYRMYFADGYRMTITLGREFPEATIQRLYLNNDETQYMPIMVTDSDVDDDGSDRVFIALDRNPDYDLGDALGYVYEDDRGTSFDGAAFKRFVQLAPIPADHMSNNAIRSIWHLYGEAFGYAALNLTTAANFDVPADADDSTEDNEYFVQLGATTEAATAEALPYFDKSRMQRRGRQINMRLQSESARELPHTLQVITLVDERPARPER